MGKQRTVSEFVEIKKLDIRDMKFGQIMYVKKTLSRIEYACEMNFDPVVKHYIFSGCSLTTCSK